MSENIYEQCLQDRLKFKQKLAAEQATTARLLHEIEEWKEVERQLLANNKLQMEQFIVDLAREQAYSAKLRKTFNKFIDSHEECSDVDEYIAQVVSMDNYHEAQEVLSLSYDDTALIEWGARLLEELAGESIDEEWFRWKAEQLRNGDWNP